ncbi:hypothetical protein XBLMG947_1650 [Xanthomonas bromi]|uniref:Uncharacterized protein n=1 Tax=Xanthomonas bromi TaxID=56449 RepID=A0A1C3NKJ9_9XANT|nr:hypothetical protein [Xanthomonas bromi]SBV50868.1 hypothetical protein XBLMG947_1650 [Xanthomonas bromi]
MSVPSSCIDCHGDGRGVRNAAQVNGSGIVFAEPVSPKDWRAP